MRSCGWISPRYLRSCRRAYMRSVIFVFTRSSSTTVMLFVCSPRAASRLVKVWGGSGGLAAGTRPVDSTEKKAIFWGRPSAVTRKSLDLRPSAAEPSLSLATTLTCTRRVVARMTGGSPPDRGWDWLAGVCDGIGKATKASGRSTRAARVEKVINNVDEKTPTLITHFFKQRNSGIAQAARPGGGSESIVRRLDALEAQVDLGLAAVMRRVSEVGPEPLKAGKVPVCRADDGIQALGSHPCNGLVAESERIPEKRSRRFFVHFHLPCILCPFGNLWR